MASFARVSADVVMELFDAPPVFTAELMAKRSPCVANVANGWTWRGSTFSRPAGQTLAEVKKARRVEVSALYPRKLATGTSYGGKTLQIDDDSQLRIVTAATAAALTGTFPSVGWRMADNAFLPLADAAAMMALGRAAADHVERLRSVMWQHKDAIEELADLGAVTAYDIMAGW